VTPLSAKARGGVKATHTRDSIIAALQAYAAAYGPDFTAAAFSPSTAKWVDRPELIDRYYAGDPVSGEPWPSLNSIKAPFNGSFNAAREAAGLPVNRPGPRARRPAGEHAPVRDVSHVGASRIIYREKDSGEVARQRARADRAEARLAALKAKPAPKARPVVDRSALDAARARATEARTTATRLAARLERSEATVTTLREDRRALKAEVTRLQRLVDAAASNVREVEVERVVTRVERVIVERPAPGEAAIAAAREAERVARARERTAVGRAETADAAYLDLAEAVNGSRRRLTAGELAKLRVHGPSGPAVMRDALRVLAQARRDGGRDVLSAALTRVASAAVSWRDRL
jgi:hypothetical protein